MSDLLGASDPPIAVRTMLGQIADKWSILILGVLCHDALRFNAIKRQLNGITQKALTDALRRLERNGIVSRHVLQGSPVAVEYRITDLGRTLEPAVLVLHTWSVAHCDDVEQARQTYDDRYPARSDGGF